MMPRILSTPLPRAAAPIPAGKPRGVDADVLAAVLPGPGRDRLALQQRRCQRVNERLVAKEMKHGIDERGVIGNLGAKLAREFDAPLIA